MLITHILTYIYTYILDITFQMRQLCVKLRVNLYSNDI